MTLILQKDLSGDITFVMIFQSTHPGLKYTIFAHVNSEAKIS